MRAAGRFVVDTHGHITTLYQPATAVEGEWDGLSGEVEPYDNSALTLYDMDRYGVDMLLLKPSMVGAGEAGRRAPRQVQGLLLRPDAETEGRPR
jgi:hypothetical protein